MYFVEDKPRENYFCDIKLVSEKEFFGLSGTKNFIVTISNPLLRQKVVDKCIRNNCLPINFLSSSLSINIEALIGVGNIFCKNMIVTSNAKIGNYCHININSYIAHDCIIEDFVTISPNVGINGNVFIKKFAFIGAGSMIKNGTKDNPLIIGEGAIVGMGSIVINSIEDYSVVYGNPATKKGS